MINVSAGAEKVVILVVTVRLPVVFLRDGILSEVRLPVFSVPLKLSNEGKLKLVIAPDSVIAPDT